jgi:STAS domain
MAMNDRCQPRLGTLTISPLPGCTGLILTGEADLTAQDRLRAALAPLPADGTGEIHLDLAGLRFIDVACTRELIALTGRHPAARLIAHHPPASLLRITALLYPDATIEFTGTSRPHAPAAERHLAARRDGCDCDSRPDGSSVPGPHPARGAMTAADITGLITSDLARIRHLAASLGQLTRSRQRAAGTGDRLLSQTWAALSRPLAVHLDAEQEICYPAIAAARPPDGLPRASAAGHFDIREPLAAAAGAEPGRRQPRCAGPEQRGDSQADPGAVE